MQVKDIVKEVEDNLKTYSSAGMDISWYGEGIHCGSKESRRGDTMPTTTNPINATNTTNVSQRVVDENLPQLLDSRGGSHVINVPAFDKEDFTNWKVRCLVFLDGLEPYLLKTLEDGPFVPMSSFSSSKTLCLDVKINGQMLKIVANQDKRLKSIIISCLLNDVMKFFFMSKIKKEIWNGLILAHEGPSDTRDTNIAALRLKFNAFKSLEGEKVNGTFTRLKCLLNDLENNGVIIPQAEVNATFDTDSDVEEDQKTNNKFMVDLNAKYHERALLDKESVSSKNEKTTRIRAFMAIAEDEPSVGKADARSGQWVNITMKKVLLDSGSVIFSCFLWLLRLLVLPRRILVLVEMDLLSFIRTAYPTKVRIGERQRDEDEPKLLENTVGRVVSLLPVAPDRSSGKLEASVDKLFDEGGSGEQVEQGVGIQLVSGSEEFAAENEVSLQPRCQKKRKIIVTDAGESSHPPKKLREDHRILSGASIGGKSRSVVQRLLAGAVQNAEVNGDPVPTFPFVTSSISATLKREGEGHTDSITGLNLRTNNALASVPAITAAIIVTPTAGPAMVKEKIVKPSLFFAKSASAGTDPALGGFADLSGSDFLVGGIRTIELLKVREKEIGDLRAHLLVKEAKAAEAIRLCVEASQFEVVEKSLQYEVQALMDRNATLEKEKSEFDVKAVDLAASVKLREQEVANLDVMVTSVKLQNDNLADHRQWLLTHGLELAIAKCLNSTEYLSTLRAAIGKAIEKGMQDRLSTGITHGAEELKSNKDASIDTIMNLLRLEDSLANKLGLTESQPHVDQLMVPIHHSPDQRVVGAFALSLSLDVSSSRVRRIKENIANHRLALRDVFVPLSEPLSVTTLIGTKGTSNVIITTVDTTTALSVTFASASLISTDDYEIVHVEGGENVGADADPFPNVDDAMTRS
nr:hypothetical protein [Tanacetum cinerariifolium]